MKLHRDLEKKKGVMLKSGKEQRQETQNHCEGQRGESHNRTDPVRRSSEHREGKDYREEEQVSKNCYKCGKEGHHQAYCINPHLCYACKKTGHISLHCPELTKGVAERKV